MKMIDVILLNLIFWLVNYNWLTNGLAPDWWQVIIWTTANKIFELKGQFVDGS